MWFVISGEELLCNSNWPLTSDFSPSGRLRAAGEDQFSMLPSRKWAVFDTVIEDIVYAVFPLQSYALICLFNCLEVHGGINV